MPKIYTTLALFTTVTLFASAESCCDESILLPAGQTEFDISNCYNCLICFGDVSDRPYGIHAVWHDEQGHSGTASDNGDGETFKIKFPDQKDPGSYTVSVLYQYYCDPPRPGFLATQKFVHVYGAIADHDEKGNTTHIECATGVGTKDGLTMNISFTSADQSTRCSAGCVSSQCVWNNASWVESEGRCTLTIDHPVLSDSGTFCCTVSDTANRIVSHCDNLSVTSDQRVTSPPHNEHDNSEVTDIIIGVSVVSVSLVTAVAVFGSIMLYRWRQRNNYDAVGGHHGQDGGPWIDA